MQGNNYELLLLLSSKFGQLFYLTSGAYFVKIYTCKKNLKHFIEELVLYRKYIYIYI